MYTVTSLHPYGYGTHSIIGSNVLSAIKKLKHDFKKMMTLKNYQII